MLEVWLQVWVIINFIPSNVTCTCWLGMVVVFAWLFAAGRWAVVTSYTYSTVVILLWRVKHGIRTGVWCTVLLFSTIIHLCIPFCTCMNIEKVMGKAVGRFGDWTMEIWFLSTVICLCVGFWLGKYITSGSCDGYYLRFACHINSSTRKQFLARLSTALGILCQW